MLVRCEHSMKGKAIEIIQVPYDSAHRNMRMGAGPAHFINNGVESFLRDRGCDVHLSSIEADTSFRSEIKTAFELNRLLAERVRACITKERFPLVLSGNCNSSLGTVAGINAVDVGIIWFDGHGDFNTPETSTSGFLDGMGLATAIGLCWKKLAASIPGFTSVAGKNAIHVGVRDYSEDERQLFAESGVTVIEADTINRLGVTNAFESPLKKLRTYAEKVYIHFDLDVLDPERYPANEFSPPGGLSVEQVVESIEMIGSRFEIAACGIASFDPKCDKADTTLHAGQQIMEAVLRMVMGDAKV